MRKAEIAWLGDPGRPVWCLWRDGALFVVHGPGEQPAPALALSTVDITVRGDHGGAILRWTASVGRVEPGSDEWDAVVPALAAKRLNAPGTVAETVARWAAECVVSRLSPTG
jgi:hypothetical protein